MARIETWVNCDLKKTVQVHTVAGNVFTQDNLGNLIGVRVFDNGEPVTLSGSVNGYCILKDNTTVPVAGSRDANLAYIVLPQSAYAVPGIIKIIIKLTEDSVITTLAMVVGTVTKSRTDQMIEPGQQVITDWSQQIAATLQGAQDDVAALILEAQGDIDAAVTVAETAAANVAGIVAPPFAKATANAAGTYVTNNGQLFYLPDGHTAGTEWADTSKQQKTVGEELTAQKSALNASSVGSIIAQNQKYTITKSVLTRKGIDSSGNYDSGSTTRLSTVGLIPVSKDTEIKFTPGTNVTHIVIVKYDADGSFLSISSWTSYAFSITANIDGFIALTFRKANTSATLTLDEFDADIELRSGLSSYAHIISSSGTNLNDLTKAGDYIFASNISITNAPVNDSTKPRYLTVIEGNSDSIKQIMYYIIGDSNYIYIRTKIGGVWNSWERVCNEFASKLLNSPVNFNNCTDGGTYIIPSNAELSNGPITSSSNALYLVNISYSSTVLRQFLFEKTSGGDAIYIRSSLGTSSWSSWKQLYPVELYASLITANSDLNNYVHPGTYVIASNTNVSNEPTHNKSNPRYLEVIAYDDNSVKQILYQMYQGNNSVYIRTRISGTWSGWKNISTYIGNIVPLFTPACSTRYIFGKGKRWEYMLNTVESFTAAGKDSRCWGMTGDIQYTSDGEIVMFHDAKVEYNGVMTNINDLTYAQIQTITLTDQTGSYTIPTVNDFLTICRKYGKIPILEAKSKTVGASWVTDGHTTELQKVFDLVIGYGMLDRVMFIGYGADMTYLDSKYYHQVGLIYTYDQHIQDWEAGRKGRYGNPYMIHAGYPQTETWTTGFDDEVMAEIHGVGSYAIGYTPPENASNYIQTMIDLNYDAIILYAEPPANP